MTTVFIGIDVGLDGAVAILPHRGPGMSSQDIPTIPIDGGRMYDIPGMVKLLSGYRGDATALVGLEKQHSMPKQGVVSVFKLGEGYGLWKGILTTLEIPYELVMPTHWKKQMLFGAPSRDKGASILKAKELFPQIDIPKSKDGRAEALLIAEFMRRNHQR